MINIGLRTAHCILLVALVFAPLARATEADDKASIAKVMRDTWDKPEARLDVGPVTVVADYAVAGWTQGDMGGRALLRRHDAHWAVVLCAGDALLSASALQQIGLPAETATFMATHIRGAEAGLAADRVAKFDAFQGMVQMDGHGAAKP